MDWRPMYRWEDLYEITSDGNVRRVARGKKLDPDKIPEAKRMLACGATLREVAEFLGTSITTAHMIKTGRTWRGNAGHRPVKTQEGSDFYIRFMACRKGKYTFVSIHRAVWETFVGPIPERMHINHKNLDRADNRLENLEVVTPKQNSQHAADAYRQNPANYDPVAKVWRGKYYARKRKI